MAEFPPGMTDNAAASRLEINADGEVAELVYRRRSKRLVLIHTGVPDSMGGHGYGGELVKGALAVAERDGLTIVPLCPFARNWLERHPDDAARVPIDWEKPAEGE